MLKERFQILLTPDQRRRLEGEARRRGVSVASLVREAVDAHFPAPSRQDRLDALQAIRSLDGIFIAPEELDRLAEAEREESLPRQSAWEA